MSSTTLHRSPPFRAEHLGSLLRPKDLLDKRDEVEHRGGSAADLARLEDASINDTVKKQLELGFHAPSDGEYRRHMFWGTFFPGLEGMEEIFNPSVDIFRPYMPDVAAFLEDKAKPGESVICKGKIRHTGQSTYMGQVGYMKSILPKAQWGDFKLTLAAPEWYHMRYKEGYAYPKSVYSSDAEYFADIAKAYRVELDILYKAGLRNVQIDDPNFAYFCSEQMLNGWREDKLNTGTVEDLLDDYIRLYNDCVSEAPADMHIGLHICRGNFVNSRHFSEGGYDRIAAKLFRSLNVHTYYLEYDTPRAGGFEPLKELPANKNVILGVITSKFPKLEDKEEMKKRIYSAADSISQGSGRSKEEALQQLGVSPQCGFASHSGGNLLGMEDMWKKLHLVRTIADEVWPGQK